MASVNTSWLASNFHFPLSTNFLVLWGDQNLEKHLFFVSRWLDRFPTVAGEAPDVTGRQLALHFLLSKDYMRILPVLVR
jgi:hypothetical protein